MTESGPAGPSLRCGAVLPGGTAAEQLEQAELAEQAGWDGVFVWEGFYGLDAWSLLAAMAVRTSRVRLGTMLTPLPWRRPWQVASQVATLDQLSGGRAILAVGIGATGLAETGEVTGVRERAEQLDEGIDLIRLLLAGGNSYHGRHYHYEASESGPGSGTRPVQDPVPVWTVGVWPRPRSLRRALRCDGIIPQYELGGRQVVPDDARQVRAWLDDHGARPGLDMLAEGETQPGDPAAAAAAVAPWAQAGCTWWLETRWTGTDTVQAMHARLAAGPPRPPVTAP
jgi:alkanesulfonate monooxygenase SsuD/methylene tetrahydromethanopterin reductase-like flavin-dependent oxidoreductase (luciferase family)